jgi:uroporphyrinogen III methyltransferase / synthase
MTMSPLKNPGKVYLVGAGPGRADLLTLRGAECLSRADVVLMDALVNPRLLDHCRPGVKVVASGKRGHGRVLMRQPQINRLMVSLARAGKTVVRLKGGDPYFFGRGGEEADHLSRHRISFEVVPGVSSVTAAPSYAGIPLTHRGHTSIVTVVTGHTGSENTYLGETARSAPDISWESLPRHGTLVVLMGTRHLAKIAARLTAAGWPEETPVSVIQWGTWPEQKAVEGTLSTIAYRAERRAVRPPAVIVIGSVVGFRDRLNWFERLPLFGRTIVVTRAESQSSELTRLLEADGARVLESPAIRIEPLPLNRKGRSFLRRLSEYDAVIFTSANAVRYFLDHLSTARSPWTGKGGGRPAVYAIGPKTARGLIDAGIPLRGIAQDSVSESLASLLGNVRGKKILVPRAAAGRDVLPDFFGREGARADFWPLYRTRARRIDPTVEQSLKAGAVDCVTFTSSSTARNFLASFTPDERKRIFKGTIAASIGPVTSQALRALGVRSVAESPRATVEDLAALVRRIVFRADR